MEVFRHHRLIHWVRTYTWLFFLSPVETWQQQYDAVADSVPEIHCIWQCIRAFGQHVELCSKLCPLDLNLPAC